ncbi:MAG: hypothetical protein JG765_2093 [Cereibacter sp.]|jgi:hypothetical protein|nr:hypothetical protein [Cereibacter sp.]
MSIKEKIAARLDELELRLKADDHLEPDGAEAIELLISSAAKFWSVLTEEERDFVTAARFAVDEQASWGGGAS